METKYRFTACAAYLLPILGWIYILVFERENEFAKFHLKQAIGLFLFLILVSLGWVVVAWGVTWLPYGFILAVALFTLVITAFLVGLFAWVLGMVNALRGVVAFLPLFGRKAHRLPFEAWLTG